MHPSGAKGLASHSSLPALVQAATTLLRSGAAAPANTAVTALRFLVNAFRFEELRQAVASAQMYEALYAAGQ